MEEIEFINVEARCGRGAAVGHHEHRSSGVMRYARARAHAAGGDGPLSQSDMARIMLHII